MEKTWTHLKVQCTAGEKPSSICFCWKHNVMVTNTEERVLVTLGGQRCQLIKEMENKDFEVCLHALAVRLSCLSLTRRLRHLENCVYGWQLLCPIEESTDLSVSLCIYLYVSVYIHFSTIGVIDHLKTAMKEKGVCEVLAFERKSFFCLINSVCVCVVFILYWTVKGMRKGFVLLNLLACLPWAFYYEQCFPYAGTHS